MVKPEKDKHQTLKFRYIYFLNAWFDLDYCFLCATLWVFKADCKRNLYQLSTQVEANMYKCENKILYLKHFSVKERSTRALRIERHNLTTPKYEIKEEFRLLSLFEKELHCKLFFLHLYSKNLNPLVYSLVRSLVRSSVQLLQMKFFSQRRYYSITERGRVFLFGELLSPCVYN